MKRFLVLFMLLLLPLALLGCGNENSAAPLDNQPHPASWIKSHPTGALATGKVADDCVICHAADLKGSGVAVSCYSCHAFNTETNFVIHPSTWTDAYTNHRGYAITNGTTTCSNCHGTNLLGSPAAPSCFSPSFDGLNCHAEGPGPAPHLLDGTFINPALHGPIAKADLTGCQGCHAQVGGPGTNPRFNLGIDIVDGTGCEACHGENLAHPFPWSGLKHASASNIQNSCTLCHGVNLDGVDGVGISCLDCHSTSPADNPTGCASCHNQPPNAAVPVGNISPNRQGQHNRGGHTSLISDTPELTCSRCHNTAGAGTAIHADGIVTVILLNTDPADTITATSDGTNTTCTGSCHNDKYGFDYPHVNKTWY